MDNYFSNNTLFRDMFKPVWLLAAIFLYTATIVLSNCLFIKPQLREFEILNEKKNQIEAVYHKIDIDDVEKKINILEQQLRKHADQQQHFNAKIMSRQDLPLVLGELNRIVETAGLTLNYIDPLPPSSKILKKYQKLPIALRLNGSYADFLEFLQRLEDASYWLLVDNYEITPSKNVGDHSFALTVFTIIK
ncbi:MAG: type 4a pilus biogenesis protein PilO [Fidelibacterota bacterium]